MKLKAKNKIITGKGEHNPGDIFEADQKDAAFLIKKGAAIEYKKDDEKKSTDSPFKKNLVEESVKEKVKAEKSAEKIIPKEDKKVVKKSAKKK